jgi:hypothetical protein
MILETIIKTLACMLIVVYLAEKLLILIAICQGEYNSRKQVVKDFAIPFSISYTCLKLLFTETRKLGK